jgi:hypothetical protein
MKHSQVLEKGEKHFLNSDSSIAICVRFTNSLLDGNEEFPIGTKIKYTFSSKNPKKKGFKKVNKDKSCLIVGKQTFPICRQEIRFFRYLGIKTQGHFWMKAELI